MSEMSRAEFDRMTPAERMAAIKAGAQIVNETASEAQERASQAAAVRSEAIAKGSIPRRLFDAMSPDEQMAHVKSGLGVVD